MKGFKIVMTLFLAVIMIAPSAMVKAGDTSKTSTAEPGHVILSYPKIETYTNQTLASEQNNPSVSIKSEPAEVQLQTQSKGIAASRSGALASKQTASKPAYSEADLYWLARVISAEARGESLEGQIAVGAVIMNRLKDDWGSTVKEVVFAPGQFDPVHDGSIFKEPTPSAVEAAKRVLQGENPVPKAYYFYNPTTATDPWIRTLRVIKRIGNHVFAASS